MLVINRKKNEKFVIGDSVEITILEVGRNRVRFGVTAPKDIRIQTHLKTQVDAVSDGSADPPEAVGSFEELPKAVGQSRTVPFRQLKSTPSARPKDKDE